MLPPAEKGFGTRLIERACSYELEGEVELDTPPPVYVVEWCFH